MRKTCFVLPLALAVLLSVGSNASDRRPRTQLSRLPRTNGSNISAIQLAKLTVPGSPCGVVGSFASVSGDTIVVGDSLFICGDKSLYVYVKPARGWRNAAPTAELTTSPGVVLFSASISGDIIVAAGTDRNDGHWAVYVYVKPPTGWKNMTQTAILTASDGQSGNCLGCSISIDGDAVVAGASGTDQYTGAAYVYVKPSGGWRDMTETAKLTASDGALGDDFGSAVGISGDTVVSGAPQVSTGDGKGYIFVKPSGGWTNMTQSAELTPSNGGFQLNFGLAAVVDGDTVLISEPPGYAAYIFIKPKTGWKDTHETAEVTDPNASYWFGGSLALQGGTAVVGDYLASPGPVNPDSGAAFLYVRPKSGWKTTSRSDATLTGSDARYDSILGMSVGMSRKTIVAGAPFAGVGYSRPGAAYVFTLP